MATGTVRFYRTNSINDEGHVPSKEEVATAWWASPEAAEWWKTPGCRFERVFNPWTHDTYGFWVPDDEGQRDAWDSLLGFVWSQKPLVIDYADSPRKAR